METQYQCEECEALPSQTNNYCGECGAGPDPWKEVPKYDFERDAELPFIFDVSVGSDNWQLWRCFCREVWGSKIKSSKIANLPVDPREFKYNRTIHYYKLDESGKLHGPFLDKKDARNA